jgi:hypothetical protein
MKHFPLIRRLMIGVAVLYAFLLIPVPEPEPPAGAGNNPFVWNQDEQWEALEQHFKSVRPLGCAGLSGSIADGLAAMRLSLAVMGEEMLDPGAPAFDDLERSLFTLAPMVGACHDSVPAFLSAVSRLRAEVKRQSTRWDMNGAPARRRIYRLLYGGREASEEVLLQMPRAAVPALLRGDNEPSQTPAAEVLGVTIHSGDVLVSRGGAPTSALIARGNDYPGNFSHVALVHVDEESGVPAVVESHIERGVTTSTLQQYLLDIKLRVMVLRLRADLPAVVADPLLPHKAARRALEVARTRHIPYDFAMDVRDTSRLFCSEVASAAYRVYGINLWMGLSSISSPGIVSWLSAFGVRHFETEEPSDLEYDPQLTVVAEWRDPETLFRDHVDNAVIDVLLEDAESGKKLTYDWYLLPLGRVLKVYSVILNWLGKEGPVPEGMGAEAALRNRRMSGEHRAIKERLLQLAEEFRQKEGYTPPYWELIKMARLARR